MKRFARPRYLNCIECCAAPFAYAVNRQVMCYCKEPWFKTRKAVVQVRPIKRTQPGFLDQVFHMLPAAEEPDQVPDQAMVIPLNQLANEVGVS